MFFRKKGEDPWDREPERKRDQAETPQAQPSGETQDWSTWKAPWESEDAEAQSPPPMTCPWCGGEMQAGWIPGKDIIKWWSGVPTAKDAWLGNGPGGGFHMTLDLEGGLFSRYLTAWHCGKCRKLVLDTSKYRLEKTLTSEEINRRIIYGTESERLNNEGENDT